MKISNTEYAPFYETYISLIPDHRDLSNLMLKTFEPIKLFLDGISDEKMNFAYAEGKWTVAQLLQHCIDTERLMAARALRVARNDKTKLPGFDENTYAKAAGEIRNTRKALIEEWKILRKSNALMFKNFSTQALQYKTFIWKHETSTRALGLVIIGHGQHHLNVLKDRYIL